MARADEAQIKQALGVQRWIKDEDFLTSSLRLASQPTINIQGLVAGYTGPGGKTVLPGRAEAKIDLRLVPDMTKDEVVAKLKAHLAKHGFGDIEVKVSGGYGPNQTDENAALIKAQEVALKRAGVAYTLFPRSAGSWPGVVFTGPPLRMAASQFGIGRGGGAHAPNEWMLIESSNPGLPGSTSSRCSTPTSSTRWRRPGKLRSRRFGGWRRAGLAARLGFLAGSGAALLGEARVATGLFLGLAQLAAALLVGFGLAGGGQVDAFRDDLHRQGGDVDRGVGDGADDAARQGGGEGEEDQAAHGGFMAPGGVACR